MNRHVKAKEEQAHAVQRLASAPKVDYSLQGTIHVELKVNYILFLNQINENRNKK
jgi:hypothetical protein